MTDHPLASFAASLIEDTDDPRLARVADLIASLTVDDLITMGAAYEAERIADEVTRAEP